MGVSIEPNGYHRTRRWLDMTAMLSRTAEAARHMGSTHSPDLVLEPQREGECAPPEHGSPVQLDTNPALAFLHVINTPVVKLSLFR